MPRTTSAAGRAAIMAREGVRLTAYRDSVGIWTVGCGHSAIAPTPPRVRPGMTITRDQADQILTADLAVFEAPVNAATIRGVSQNQFDAMVSLAFNIGVSAFARSTVARKIASGDVAGAADAFMMWVHPPELRGRREAERKQFLTPDGIAEVPGAPRLDGIIAAINHAAAAPAVPSPGPLPVSQGPHSAKPEAEKKPWWKLW